MHWPHHRHKHSGADVPQNAPQGAQWSPNVQPYDRNRPPFPSIYSDEEKQAQFEAGDRLRADLDNATRSKAAEFTMPPGVYRIREPLILEDTEGFTLNAANVELIVEPETSHFRVLGNRDLTVRGPFVLDADPHAWTQGEIVDLNQDELTIDVQLFEGYRMPTEGSRIEIFTPDGYMLPHTQDDVQGFSDLGDHVVRLKMNGFTWSQHAEGLDEVLRRGNLIAVEIKGKGGLEMRNNTNTTWEDVSLHSHGLSWAMPEFGEDKFIRWNGSRRRDTNRLVGGGFPLMTFKGGAYTLLDSELGHNFDDLTDINTFQSFAFQQVGPRQFHIMDEHIEPGYAISIHDYTTMLCDCQCRVESVEDSQDPDVREAFKRLAEKFNVRDLGEAKLCTVDTDVQLPELSYVSIKPSIARSMRFERNYIHDGLSAGIAAKGADSVIIRDNIVERAANLGITVSLDPFWWEGNPSRNIEITGNTVRNCSYAPNDDHPGIGIYVGGSHAGMPGPKATAQLHDGIVIYNNAIYSAGGAGISVTNSRNVLINGNLIADSNANGCARGSIFLNAVPEGTRVEDNIFAGADSGMEAVQIRTGPHNDARSIAVSNNRAINPEIVVPNLPWHFYSATDPAVELSGDGWYLEDNYPEERQLGPGTDAAITFGFYGSRVRVLGGKAPWAGIADVFLDDQFVETIDNSRRFEEQITSYYISPVLQEGHHRVRLVNKAQAGRLGEGDRQMLAVHGFDVLAVGFGFAS